MHEARRRNANVPGIFEMAAISAAEQMSWRRGFRDTHLPSVLQAQEARIKSSRKRSFVKKFIRIREIKSG